VNCQTVALLVAQTASGMMLTSEGRPASLGFLDSDIYPIRCHWSHPSQEVRCPAVLEVMETSWEVQVDTLGFYAPQLDGTLGGSDAVDVYLTRDGTQGGAYALCTWREGSCVDADAEDGRSGAAAFVAVDARLSDALMPGYLAHEFNHVLQYGTDFHEPALTLWEGTANAATWWTLGDRNPVEPVRDFQRVPWMSLFGDGYVPYERGIWLEYEYGAELWFHHLEQWFGEETGDATVRLWAGLTQDGDSNQRTVLDSWDALTGDWRLDLLRFTEARGRVGTTLPPSWALGWLDEAQEVGAVVEVPVRRLPTRVFPEWDPLPLGVFYVDIVGTMRDELLRVGVRGASGVDWGIATDQHQAWGTDEVWLEVLATEGVTRISVVNLAADQLDLVSGDWGALTASMSRQPVEVALERVDSADHTDVPVVEDDGVQTVYPVVTGGGCGCQHGRVGWMWALVLMGWRRRR
jgi:hypothetical protein